eukprot:s1955_g10.t2
MGKRGQRSAKEWEAYYSSSAWEEQQHGNRQPKPWGKGKSKEGKKPKEAHAFPSFEEMPSSSRAKANGAGRAGKGNLATDSAPASAHSHGQGCFSKSIQKVVNNLRRCETRLRKIDEETADIDAKWTEWQVQMKRSFIAERSRFYEAMNRLKAEKLEMQEDMEIEEIPDEAQKEWDELLVDAVRNEDVAAVETGDAITPGHGPSLEHVGTARMAMNTHLRGCLRAPPALVNEQIAIATAPLWFAQTLTYLHHASVTIHYDCQVAGFAANGDTTPTTHFMTAVRGIHHFVAAIFGKEPVYELVDVAAKAVARQGFGLPRPPAEAYRLLQDCDLTWLAAAVDPAWRGVLPICITSLQWQPQDDFGPSPLKPEQLVPAKQVQCGAVRSPRNATAKIFTLNALGTKNKHRYFEDQLDHLGIHIAMFQGTKSAEGLCALTIDNRPWIIGETDIRPLVSCPSLLIVMVHKDACGLIVISA